MREVSRIAAGDTEITTATRESLWLSGITDLLPPRGSSREPRVLHPSQAA
jgi:hypothetical protein